MMTEKVLFLPGNAYLSMDGNILVQVAGHSYASKYHEFQNYYGAH